MVDKRAVNMIVLARSLIRGEGNLSPERSTHRLCFAMRQSKQRLYKTPRWRSIRRQQLRLQPLCKLCADRGLIVAAEVCDHVTPHKGDELLFFNGPFQSLCASCHNGAKQSLERTGRLRGVDDQGNPVDPEHHWR